MEFFGFLTQLAPLFAIATFFIGRNTASKTDGKEAGAVASDIKYIKESIQRMETRMDADIGKLEARHNDDMDRMDGRVDELGTQLLGMVPEITAAAASAKSAHRRLNEHVQGHKA